MNSAPTDPRQPVLVGVGTCMQREEDYSQAREPMDLMLEAVRSAAADSGSTSVLAGVERIAVPKGRWRYNNPAGEIARSIGASSATTVLASVGVLQQSLVGEACSLIARGEINTALIAGADAGYRILRAQQAGHRATERQQDDAPHERRQPLEELLHPAELRAGIRMPVALYAIIESAWRAKQGWTVAEHRQTVATMLQRFSEIAAGNPHAWRRKPVGAVEVSEATDRNPMQAFPYTRLHCAAWNVDQAGAMLLCSAGKAQQLGIARDKWVYAVASTESNHMVPVSARAELAGCPGALLAGRAALCAGGIGSEGPDLVELYSCFPIAVESYAQELGLSLARDLTVTGGMQFAGGPFNNYVLQASCRMAQLIRSGHGRTGLVSSVSGVLTKQGFGLWADAPGNEGFVSLDVTADTAQMQGIKEVVEAYSGAAVVAGYTVLYGKNHPARALVLADTHDGRRALAWSENPALVQRIEAAEFCGQRIEVQGEVFALA